MVELRILGPPQLVASDGQAVETLSRQPKRAALLAYLAAAPPRGFHRRDKLLALFWPELDGPHARNALSQALHVLRTALGEGAILTRGDGEVGLNLDVVRCDATAFEAALDAGRPADALALYRGELLDGFFISGAPEFERWLDAERDRLRQRASEGAWALAEAKAPAAQTHEAARWARRAADLSAKDEAAVRRLMSFLHGLGDRTAAIHAYEEFSAALLRDYEFDPSSETQGLAAAIRREEQKILGSPPATVLPTASDAALAAARALDTFDAVGPSERRRTRPRALLPTTLAGLGVAAILLYGFIAQSGGASDPRSRAPRIVVLPFQNLGPPEDAYFAEGITDEITARLAMIREVGVLGRQAALQYRNSDKTPQQIAEESEVDFILEGTVTWQRSSSGRGQVRVRPQLIDARDGTHLWAAVLDGDMNDLTQLFALLTGIADRVVDELHVAVEAPERRGASTIPTTSLEAYDFYLRGREFKMRGWSDINTRAAIQMLERAVEKDPEFALAHAWLSFSHTEAFWLNSLSADHLDRAKQTGETALSLDPDLPDAHTSMGHYYYVCCEDYERALAHLERSHAERPGDAQVVMFIGNVHKRQGHWEEALVYYDRAANLDPRWESPFLNIAQMELWRRRYDDVERAIGRALSINPQVAFGYSIWAWVPLLRDGDAEGARHVLREAARASDAFESIRLQFYVELLHRNYGAALTVASRKSHSGEAWDEWLDSDHIRRAVAFLMLGDSASARVHFDSARVELEEELQRAFPHSRRTQNVLRSALAVSYAGMGRRSDAIEQADLVRAADPPAIDAISGPISLQNVALAYVLVGEHDAALDVLEELLSIPARLSPELLRLDPLWDPLRADPRFERLLRGRV